MIGQNSLGGGVKEVKASWEGAGAERRRAGWLRAERWSRRSEGRITAGDDAEEAERGRAPGRARRRKQVRRCAYAARGDVVEVPWRPAGPSGPPQACPVEYVRGAAVDRRDDGADGAGGRGGTPRGAARLHMSVIVSCVVLSLARHGAPHAARVPCMVSCPDVAAVAPRPRAPRRHPRERWRGARPRRDCVHAGNRRDAD